MGDLMVYARKGKGNKLQGLKSGCGIKIFVYFTENPSIKLDTAHHRKFTLKMCSLCRFCHFCPTSCKSFMIHDKLE